MLEFSLSLFVRMLYNRVIICFLKMGIGAFLSVRKSSYPMSRMFNRSIFVVYTFISIKLDSREFKVLVNPIDMVVYTCYGVTTDLVLLQNDSMTNTDC